MKKFLLVFVLLIVITTSVFAAQPVKGVGVGLTTGLPFHIGPTAEYNFGPAYAGMSLGYGYFSSFWLRFEGGYNFPKPFVHNDWGIDLYLSVGGYFDLQFTGGSTFFGIGIPVTWSYTLPKVPVKVYAKAGPEIYFSGWGAGVGFIGSIGGMYIFEL